MADITQTIQSAHTQTLALINLIEQRPSIDQQAQGMLSQLNLLQQNLSDLGNDKSRIAAASALQSTMTPLFITPLEYLISMNLNMSKLGPLNRSKTVPDNQALKENALAKGLVANLRDILSSLGGNPFVPNPTPPGPIAI
ncbi:hypothetical protein [Thalassospira alkalitolerans]|uniref:Uncharacterized protein n=1 Tax=Thalassospira alkalitolerans TaxID=1293890 RepID=A0A1Y2LBH0_9PROT|nr:hypothetical protein [Thalassospira alkalitolerans]OSQ48067.1 hypothetical protein TALK_10785 [Thalassospira alkalitolerans]|tara:strand:- start:35186 stop:35605 length:420 start_codon:yes stop_codon:yes gene_type:complete